MAFRIRKFIASTPGEIEEFVNLLPVDVHILGAPQQVTLKGKKKWIVWLMPYTKLDGDYLKDDKK